MPLFFVRKCIMVFLTILTKLCCSYWWNQLWKWWSDDYFVSSSMHRRYITTTTTNYDVNLLYTHTHTHTHTHARTHARTHAPTHARTHARSTHDTCTHARTRTYTTHTHTRTFTDLTIVSCKQHTACLRYQRDPALNTDTHTKEKTLKTSPKCFIYKK